MMKIKNILTISLFSIVVFGICFASVFLADSDVSYAERRKLEQISSLSDENVFSSDFSGKLETYFLDQFPMRDKFRSINMLTRYWAFKQKDINGIWERDGYLFKNEKQLDENQVLYATKLINKIIDTTLKDANVYYSIIPDKNYFLEKNADHSRFDYEGIMKLLNDNITSAEYIDIYDTLKLSDYYKTDTHWSQDKIFNTVQKLADGMGMTEHITQPDEYTINTLNPFYGVYYGQASLNAKPDSLLYMTSKYTDNSKVYGINPEILKNDFGVEDNLSNLVYSVERFNGIDGYDVFLSGAQPVVVIENTEAKTEKELVIFRDSYGSSIAPLFTGAYSKITLIDLRYIPSMLISDYVEFKEGQDVLFLYSVMMMNNSMTMK